jgi:hypothetical protein
MCRLVDEVGGSVSGEDHTEFNGYALLSDLEVAFCCPEWWWQELDNIYGR